MDNDGINYGGRHNWTVGKVLLTIAFVTVAMVIKQELGMV